MCGKKLQWPEINIRKETVNLILDVSFPSVYGKKAMNILLSGYCDHLGETQ